MQDDTNPPEQQADCCPADEAQRQLENRFQSSRLARGEQVYELVMRVSKFRKSWTHVLVTTPRFPQPELRDILARTRGEKMSRTGRRGKAGSRRAPTTASPEVKPMEEILLDLSYRMDEGCRDKVYGTNPVVANALTSVCQAVDYSEMEERLWSLNYLEFHAAFSLLQRGATMNRFQGVLGVLLCHLCPLAPQALLKFLETENRFIEFRMEEREEVVESGDYKVEEIM